MNHNKKTYKLSHSTSPQPPTKLKIITNGNGVRTAVPANGKLRGRPPKYLQQAAAEAAWKVANVRNIPN